VDEKGSAVVVVTVVVVILRLDAAFFEGKEKALKTATTVDDKWPK
jgi:hypothetical protein